MTKDEALRLALEALEKISMGGDPRWTDEAITAIKEALETKDEPMACAECGVGGGHALYCVACAEKYVVQTKTKDEPVAWMSTSDVGFKKSEFGSTPTVPLYTTPPQSTWVGLTDEDVYAIGFDLNIGGIQTMKAYQAIEAKLKEKNT